MSNDPTNKDLVSPDLQGQLDALREQLAVLRDLVDDALHPGEGDRQPADGDAPFQPRFDSVEAWVHELFAPTYARPTNPQVRWCAEWWDHAEAISRLEALWRTWEVARLDELRGIATWYRDFLDPQLAVLLSPTGPFLQCTPDRHSPVKPLPTSPAPEGYWNEPDGEPLPDDSPYRSGQP